MSQSITFLTFFIKLKISNYSQCMALTKMGSRNEEKGNYCLVNDCCELDVKFLEKYIYLIVTHEITFKSAFAIQILKQTYYGNFLQ